MNADERVSRFMELINKADTTRYIAMVAIPCSDTGNDDTDIVEEYSRNDLKRAIKALRGYQAYAPQYAECYEDAIVHIRKNWLHRKEEATCACG